jgi:hypothetical protein
MGRTGGRAVKSVTAAADGAYSGMRSLSEVTEQARVIRAMRQASIAEAEADCVYASTRRGEVTRFPITGRTKTLIRFGDRYVKRDYFDRHHYAYVSDHPAEWQYVYASPGLAEALAGEGLPDRLPDWRDEEDKARDHRALMRRWYEMLHEQVDRLAGMWEDYDPCYRGFITEDEAVVIHARIDEEVKAEGYWDDGLPACWWRDEHRATLRQAS